MNLPIHVLKKDLRRYWPLAALAAVFIVLSNLGPLWGLNFEWAQFEKGVPLLELGKWAAIFILVVAVMQEDRTAGDAAFWRTRPIGAGALLAGKVLFFVLVVALPAVLANIRIASALDTPGPVALGIAVETTGFMLLAVLAGALLASITGSLLQAGLAALGGLFVIYVAGAAREALVPYVHIRLPWDTDIAFPGPRVAFACLLAGIALMALLTHQFFTRRTGRTVALLAIAVPLVLATAATWTGNFIPPYRARAFPAKPLKPTEGIGFKVETPARVLGSTWRYDAANHRHHPEFHVAVYADFHGVLSGRFLELVEARSTLRLRDGRELIFPPVSQFQSASIAWTNSQRDGAISQTLGLESQIAKDQPDPQGTIQVFSLPKSELAALGGTRGRLTTLLVLGESAFREEFRLPVRASAVRREPGEVWRIAQVAGSEDASGEIILEYLRANTMLAPGGKWGADTDPKPAYNPFFVLLNRKLAEYAYGFAIADERKPGVIASIRYKIMLNRLRHCGRSSPDFRIDDAWLADAELVVLSTELLGKTEKNVVVDDFEVPRLDQ